MNRAELATEQMSSLEDIIACLEEERRVVGEMVSKGRLSPEDLHRLILSQNRCIASMRIVEEFLAYECHRDDIVRH